MDLQITTRHMKTSSSLRNAISEKLNRIQRFYEKCTSCHVVLDRQHADQIVEIVMTVRGRTLTAKAKSDHIGKSVDSALEKLERQLKKTNQRVKNHKATKVSVAQRREGVSEPEVPEEESEDE